MEAVRQCALQGAQEPSRAFIEESIKKNEFRIHAIARQFRHVDIDDACQIGRIALMQCLRRYDPSRGSVWAFAKTRVVHAILRYGLRRVPLPIDPSDIDIASTGASPEDVVSVRKILEALPETDRFILLSRVLGGYTLAEIGELIGREPCTVMRIYDRTIARFAEGQ